MLVSWMLIIVATTALISAEWIPIAWRSAWLIVTNLVSWAGGSGWMVNSRPFLAGVTGPEERPHAFALNSVLLSLGGLLGSALGGYLPGWFAAALDLSRESPTPYTYGLMSIPLLYGMASWAMTRTKKSLSHARRPVRREPGRLPYAMIGLLASITLVSMVGARMAITFFNLYADAELGLPTSQIGAMRAAG